MTMGNKAYEVWVGGWVVNDYQLRNYTEADKLAKRYREDGYDDVHIEVFELDFT
jgi:hypothetical protein